MYSQFYLLFFLQVSNEYVDKIFQLFIRPMLRPFTQSSLGLHENHKNQYRHIPNLTKTTRRPSLIKKLHILRSKTKPYLISYLKMKKSDIKPIKTINNIAFILSNQHRQLLQNTIAMTYDTWQKQVDNIRIDLNHPSINNITETVKNQHIIYIILKLTIILTLTVYEFWIKRSTIWNANLVRWYLLMQWIVWIIDVMIRPYWHLF